MKRSLLMMLACIALAGCAGAPQLYKVDSVYVCAAEECAQAGQRYKADQMLDGLHRLFVLNDGQDLKICSSDKKTRTCESSSICHFVMGGPIPGAGCGLSMKIGQAVLESAQRRIRTQSTHFNTFIGIPLVCASSGVSISVASPDEITWEDDPHYCNWMAVGNMTETFAIAVESVDFDRGIVGGYWTHAVAGTGSGSGSGYLVLVFPKPMPRGENWLAEKP
jgi:hypothetical protein